MSEPTVPDELVDLAPHPSPLIAEPATVEACAQDYADAPGVRHVMDEQIAGRRH